MKKAIIIPISACVILILILYMLKIPNMKICKIDFVMNAIVTCVVTLAGFILTSISIIISMSGSPIMKKIITEGGFKELKTHYTMTLILSLVLIIVCIGLGITIGEDNVVNGKGIIIGSSVLVSYFISLVSTCYYLLRIISEIPNNRNVEVINEPSVPKGDFR